jgi:hypothetical protein
MPPRRFVIALVVAWLAALAWLGWDRWGVRLVADDCPPLTRDLSDAVAPRDVGWNFTRQGAKAGSADSRMAPKSNKNFDLNWRAHDLEFVNNLTELKITFFQTNRSVTPANTLVGLTGKASMTVRYFNKPEEKVETKLTVHVRDGGCDWEHEVTFGTSEPVHVKYRTDLPAASPLVPLDPLQKYPGLRPGQSWLTTLIDPVTEVGTVVLGLTLKQAIGVSAPPNESAVELLARVQDETETIEGPGKTHVCRVIEFSAKGISAKVWVDEADDTVVRQEASVFGQTIRAQRE